GTFWEGIDIKGQDLSQVIIPRLPFPVPDPIIQYKTSLYDDKMEVLMPEMIMKLRQGIGRLIRTDSDKGIVSILDTRAYTNYKDQILNSILDLRQYFGHIKVKFFSGSLNKFYIKTLGLDVEPLRA